MLCSQVEKFKEVTDTLSDRQKNVEDHIEKVPNQQVAMNRSMGYLNCGACTQTNFGQECISHPISIVCHV
jgi:hypothetical protein